MHNIVLLFLFIIIWFVGLFSGKMDICPLNSERYYSQPRNDGHLVVTQEMSTEVTGAGS